MAFNKPDKDKVLDRFVMRLGPQLSVTHMLSHLGDRGLFTPFAPGDEPTWVEVLAALMAANPQFSVRDVLTELNRRPPS